MMHHCCLALGCCLGSASVEAYDEIIAGEVKAYLDLSAGVGGEVADQAELVSAAFAAQRAFLVQVSESKKPADAEFMSLIGATSAAMGAVSEFKEKNFKSKQFNHLSAVAEGLVALGWVTVSPKPAPYVPSRHSPHVSACLIFDVLGESCSCSLDPHVPAPLS
jgi:adenylyl cyclase-associated protein